MKTNNSLFNTFLFFSCLFVISLLCSRVFAADAVPDIKANSSSSPVTISMGDNLTVAVSLAPGSRIGENADWWVVVNTPFGWFHYDVLSGSWVPDLIVTFQGSLFNLTPPLTVLSMPGLPPGIYWSRHGHEWFTGYERHIL